jgi:hypothetical protein
MREFRIALTGGSSTGKTTLATALFSDEDFRRVVPVLVPEGARALLENLSPGALDLMDQAARRTFQRRYFAWKRDAEGSHRTYLADRSFVDLAATSIERDGANAGSDSADIVSACRELAANYTLHIHLPAAKIPFVHDGFREGDMPLHKRIAQRILSILNDWQLVYVSLRAADVPGRVAEVKALLGLGSRLI